MSFRQLAARALTVLPAIVLAGAAIVQVRAHATVARAAVQPRAVTFLVDLPKPHTASNHHVRPPRAAL